MTHLSHVFLLAFNVDSLTKFYAETLGLELAYQEPGTCAFFELGGARLAIYPQRKRQVPADMFLVLDVPDLEAAKSQLEQRGAKTSAARAVPFGRAFDVIDPEGNRIEFHQPD